MLIYNPVLSDTRFVKAKVRLSRNDYRVLVNGIEVEDNFDSIYSTSRKTTVGGQAKVTKPDGFKSMANYFHLNTANRNLPRISA